MPFVFKNGYSLSNSNFEINLKNKQISRTNDMFFGIEWSIFGMELT